ncbi:hypothetical protein GCM10022280_22070 [Sphingomonas swuensis]|uniref:Uncharacterized protein n=1 Tax=Sphingomonas swuensis TaxID=977800 RepID=A0ABP7T6T2_9SPHN
MLGLTEDHDGLVSNADWRELLHAEDWIKADEVVQKTNTSGEAYIPATIETYLLAALAAQECLLLGDFLARLDQRCRPIF